MCTQVDKVWEYVCTCPHVPNAHTQAHACPHAYMQYKHHATHACNMNVKVIRALMVGKQAFEGVVADLTCDSILVL